MSTSDKIKSNDDGVYEVNGMLQNMNTNDTDVVVCANCGKEGSSNNMNTCNKCKVTTYCNAVCKKVHKKKHKKECEEYVRLAAEKRAEELRIAAKQHDIELFKQPPPAEDCPICFLRLPSLDTGSKYMPCCGKMICSGCIYAPLYDDQGNKVDNKKCPFCRTPQSTSDEETIKRMKKRVESGDAQAMYEVGCFYFNGTNGFTRDYTKALELYHQAGKLGFAKSYTNIGVAYNNGQGVEVDKKMANHYYELAAMGGNEIARHNLGNSEARAGNFDRAVKHYMIAIQDGRSESLDVLKQLYTLGHSTKDDYMKALHLYQTYLGEIKSVQRDEAAAVSDRLRHY